ncbi:hypothetical protein [Burkholderia gladioli]|uniref:hypothetical protein n=1 Tax=Burkholderia gladioli TaxID=28095 RepID=UPI001ABA58C2|nr:hypothetical protein [Burkholderia gladioli]
MAGKNTRLNIYFSDVFRVDPETLEEHGAFNVALVNDLPLFVDPFLLYDSPKPVYRGLHDGIISYLCFLRDRAVAGELTPGAISQWLLFKEVKQNWLGFSKNGNVGTGLGPDFARALARNLTTAFKDFGDETISHGSHLEKLGLLSGGVGRDHLSDFTTNLIKGYLLEYTQTFALTHVRPEQRTRCRVERVRFDYETQRWQTGYFELPVTDGDYVILTPKEILTRDEAWINQTDLLDRFHDICVSLPDDGLRTQINEHFYQQIDKRTKEKEKRAAAMRTIERFHDLLDYYIRWKEEHGFEAHRSADAKVQETHLQFVENIRALVDQHLAGSEFYSYDSSYEQSMKRVMYLKHVIEDQGGQRLFYINGQPVQREVDLHVMFRLTWFANSGDLDLNAEVNNGRGPVDFKISKGKKNSNLVEFKLAKNTSLEKNLQHQVEIYEKASDSPKSIKVIMHFSDAEFQRVMDILKRLKLTDCKDIVLIDASPKISASKAGEH